MYLDRCWYRLVPKAGTWDAANPVASLDVSILQDNLLHPILGIGDPRRDTRIDFVGGIRGLDELVRRVDSGREVVAFAMYPTSMDELLSIADAGMIMHPKSTWFEPKLRSGLFIHPLTEQTLYESLAVKNQVDSEASPSQKGRATGRRLSLRG